MLTPPTTRAQLHDFVRAHFSIHLAQTKLIDAHTPPFDYLVWSFFEGMNPDSSGAPRSPADALVWANRGGGKTFLAALATALDLLFKPSIQIRLLGGSLDQSARMHAHLRALCQAPILAERLQGRITERRVQLDNGSAAEILAQSQTSVRGTRVQKLRCDEVELFDPDVWEAAQLTTRSMRAGPFDIRGGIECLSTMHVPHGLMQRLVEDARGGGRILFKWGVLDVLARCTDEHTCETCPLHPECQGKAKARADEAGHIPVADAIAMKSRVALCTWESEMLCLRPRRTDAVLPEFDPRLHVVNTLPWEQATPPQSSPPPPRPFVAPSLPLASIDFGFRAPTVILWARLDEHGTLWITDERSVAGEVLASHIDAILNAPAQRGQPLPAWIGVDPAGAHAESQTGRSAVDELRAAGLTVRYRASTIHSGLALVRARLKPADGAPPRLFIHDRCRELIRSMERYHYPPDRPECTDPVKDGADHAVDALRYLITNLDRPYTCRQGNYTCAA